MLNEELKIKIIQYLDGELDQGAENEIEEILDSNEEANDFCNQMKSLNINLKEFAHTSEYQAYSKKADALIDTIVDKHLGSKKRSYTFSFKDFLTPQNITGYALTAALFLSVGIFYDESNYENETIFELNQTTFERNVFKKRNMTQDENIKDILKSTIAEMVNGKSANGKLTYGTETYLIFLDSKPVDELGLSCYYGNVFNDGDSQKILFCKSEEDLSLTYIN
jgi:glutaredoxin 2